MYTHLSLKCIFLKLAYIFKKNIADTMFYLTKQCHFMYRNIKRELWRRGPAVNPALLLKNDDSGYHFNLYYSRVYLAIYLAFTEPLLWVPKGST